ncbi:PASTA domain-containing protein [Dactylosporangium sp. NPDC000521]|uniref:PASTA domain-containing protein n=1 Tax=Dactylosporangium sp. NPDC000521 TaxID=3363975 RepID=UPI0036AD41FD
MSGFTDRLRSMPLRLPGRSSSTGERVNRAALAVVLCGAVIAVGLGVGYRSSRAAYGDGGAFLQKDTRVVHVNADNRDADAVVAKQLATGKQMLEVVQVRPGVVYVVNNDTGTVTLLPTDTLDPKTVDKRPDSQGKLTVVSGGGDAYLLDSQRGTVSRLDGTAGQQTQVTDLPPVDRAVVDGAGTAWGYAPASGELVEIVKDKMKSRQRVLSAGERAELTLVGGAPVIYVPHTGQAGMYGPDGPKRMLDLDATFGVLAAPGAAATVAVAVPRTGELVLGEFSDERDVRRITLPGRAGHRFGAPVIHKDRVYLPDFTARHVIVVHTASGKVETEQPVPGRSDSFQVFSRDDHVWVNDPHDTAVVITFDADGRPTTTDLTDATKPSPSPKASPKPSGKPSASPSGSQPSAPASAAPQQPVTLPNLVGVDRADACARLAQLSRQLRCRLVAQPDGPADTDKVTGTDPPAGSRVNPRSTVTVFYRGPAQVPDVTKLPAGQACRALIAASLTCREQVGGLAADGGQVRVVTAQSPAPGTAAATGTPVTVTYPDMIAVPNLVGQPPNVACPTGLTCAPHSLGPGTPAYVVIAQQPAAGTGLAPGATVTLDHYVHGGVGNLVGMSPDEACANLAQQQLGCTRSDTAQILSPIGVVVAQDQPPGAALPVGTAVTITYQSRTPVPMNRFKAPGARRGNFLSPGGGGPAGFSSQGPIGRIYPVAMAAGMPGLTLIYQSHCERGCGEVGGYYYSANPNTPANWVMDGPAFACFADQIPGTVPIRALFHPGAAAWAWAEPGSGEYNAFVAGGFGSQYDFTLCHVWPRS